MDFLQGLFLIINATNIYKYKKFILYMAIVSMTTESYVNWLHHFLTSLEDTIPNEKKIIFLINVKAKTKNKLKKRFPKVQFISEKKQIVRKESGINNVFKVTYLKGEFMEKAYIRLGEPLLWIDCTALIKKSPEDLLNRLESLDVLLMRRNFKKDFGKNVYACEIFGMNDLETIKQYRANCEKRKTEWYADQLALCEIQTKNRGLIKFGKWSNFYYEEEACSWSDRGKTGKGIFNEEDYDYTELKFIDNLENRFPGYEKEFNLFFQKEKTKPKILIHIDDFQWCYFTTIKQITERLKEKYDFLIIADAKKDYPKYKDWKGDLVWARCSSKRHQKLLNLRPDLRKISFSTVTTGGDLGDDRTTAHLQSNKEEVGIICQNKDIEFRLKYKLKKIGRKQEVFILPNGVDTEKFKPKSMTSMNSIPFIGFVGRTRTYPEDFLKGYSSILKPVCEELNLELKSATNDSDRVRDFKDMPEFYNKIGLLVLLSHSEGHSNTINEAMASGIPVIAFPTGWHYENAQNQGIIWCQRNTIELLEILSDFKSNFKHYEALGQKNRKFAVNELSWDVVAKHYDITLQKMIRKTKIYIPNKQNNKLIKNLFGKVKIKYIAEDNGIDGPYGIFRPGKEYSVGPEAYNYFKNHFANKFEFED